MFPSARNVAALLSATSIMCGASLATAAPRLDYSGYLAGSGDDSPTAIAYYVSGGPHSSESVYIGGSTNSRDLAGMSAGAFSPTLYGEQQRCFVSKLSADGQRLHYTSVLPVPSPRPGDPLVGSSHLDRSGQLDNGECRVTAVAVDPWGAVYVAGVTSLVHSGDANHAAALPQGTLLGFVQKYEESAGAPPTGLTLVWSKLFGDANPDSVTSINALKIVASGNEIAIAGNTTSAFYPVTTGPVASGSAYQTKLTGKQSGVVTKLDPGGGVLRSTYLGVLSTTDRNSRVTLTSLDLDASGAVVVGGGLDSIDNIMSYGTHPDKGYPISPNAWLPSNIRLVLGLFGLSSYTDGVLTKLNPELSQLAYSTIVTGMSLCTPAVPRISHTLGTDVAVNANGDMYMAAITTADCIDGWSAGVPTKKHLSGHRDGLVIRVPANGYSTPTGMTYSPYNFQTYAGFGHGSGVNRCKLSVSGPAATGEDSVYLACSVVGARLKHIEAQTFPPAFTLDRIAVRMNSVAPPGDPDYYFPSENLFVVRLQFGDRDSRIAYTAGIGGTYGFDLNDLLLTGNTLRFVGSTSGADFPITTNALDQLGRTNADGVLGFLRIDVP